MVEVAGSLECADVSDRSRSHDHWATWMHACDSHAHAKTIEAEDDRSLRAI